MGRIVHRVVWAAALLLLWPLLTPASAQRMDPPEAPDWCAMAERYLVRANGLPFDCAAPRLRCIRMNNYGCVKQGRDPWVGTRFGDFPDGARDLDGHAIFEHPKFSLRAMARLYETYARRGADTALSIAEQYSPWCDTLGSVPVRGVHARSCAGGRQPDPGWTGARCERPADGRSTPAQCRDCNCPDRVAVRMVEGLGLGIEDRLLLFEADGRPAPALPRLLSNKMAQELGVRPTEVLLGEFTEFYRAQPR